MGNIGAVPGQVQRVRGAIATSSQPFHAACRGNCAASFIKQANTGFDRRNALAQPFHLDRRWRRSEMLRVRRLP